MRLFGYHVLWSAAVLALLSGLIGTANASAASPEATPADGKSRPNIIVIALDDVGYSDLGCFGAEISTPNIDHLASAGLRFTRFDTNAICSPTRASLLTGRNCQTVRMGDLPSSLPAPDPDDLSNRRGELLDNAETIAQALKRVGYATFAIGKWHLSPEYETGAPGHNASFSLQRGFEHFYGFKMGWTDQYHPSLYQDNAPIPMPDRPGFHLSEDLVDHAIGAIRDSRTQTPHKPVFLYLSFGFAHAPIQVPQDYIARNRDVYAKGWDAIRADEADGIDPETHRSPTPRARRSWLEQPD